MIQRLQTVFLVLAILFNFSVYYTPIYEKGMADPQMWIGYGMAISLLLSMLITGFSIFLYENRSNQISWIKRAMYFQVAGIGFCLGVLFSLGGIGSYLWDEALGTGMAILTFAFQLLAIRFIRKDEELVRSMDRIR